MHPFQAVVATCVGSSRTLVIADVHAHVRCCCCIAQFFDDPMLLELARQDAELGLS